MPRRDGDGGENNTTTTIVTTIATTTSTTATATVTTVNTATVDNGVMRTAVDRDLGQTSRRRVAGAWYKRVARETMEWWRGKWVHSYYIHTSSSNLLYYRGYRRPPVRGIGPMYMLYNMLSSTIYYNNIISPFFLLEIRWVFPIIYLLSLIVIVTSWPLSLSGTNMSYNIITIILDSWLHNIIDNIIILCAQRHILSTLGQCLQILIIFILS